MAEKFITMMLTEDDAVALGFTDEEIAMAKRGEKIYGAAGRARQAALAATPPVATEYPAPVMTVEEWAQSASSLILAAEIVLDGVDEVRVEALKNATMDFVPTSTDEGDLLAVCIDFCRQYRKHKMFGDEIADEFNILKEAVAKIKEMAAPPQPTYVDPYAEEPYLYILMRNDLASMNPGKAVAQGTHAANQMVYEARINTIPDLELVAIWQTRAKGFGTCICLSVSEEEMRTAVKSAQDAGLHAGITHDPSYPLRDGGTLHLLPLDTCAYIFGKKSACKPFVGSFPLMP